MIKLCLAVLFLTAASTQAQAQWLRFSERPYGVSYYYQTNSVSRAGNSVTFWSYVEKGADKSKPNHMEIDCGKSRYRILNPQNSWSEIAPDSMIEIMKKQFCKK